MPSNQGLHSHHRCQACKPTPVSLRESENTHKQHRGNHAARTRPDKTAGDAPVPAGSASLPVRGSISSPADKGGTPSPASNT